MVDDDIESDENASASYRDEEVFEGADDLHPIGIGNAFRISRASTQEDAALKVNRISSAIANVIVAADGDVTLAIFGAWGRGKSYLAERIVHHLERRYNYGSIWFNAWRFQEPPGLWAHFYRSICDSLQEEVVSRSRFRLLARIGIVARLAILRHGKTKAFVTILGTLFVFLPFAFLLNIILFVAGALGFACLLLVVHIGRSTSQIYKHALAAGEVHRHDEHIGLQGIISDDLRLWLQATIPSNVFGSREDVASDLFRLSYSAVILSLIVVLASAYREAFFELGDFADRLPSILDWRLYASIGVWLFGIGVVLFSVTYGVRGPKNAVLVVDDVDRCSPGSVLQIVESIKMLMDDIEVRSRVRIIVLCEESILRSVCRTQISKVMSENEYDVESAIDEHLSKLFLIHLRLLDLSDEEVIDIAEKFVHSTRNSIENVPEVYDEEELPIDAKELSHQVQVFSEAEEDLLLKAVKDFSKSSSNGSGRTIRQIRQFFIKYQLGREILRETNTPWHAEELVGALMGGNCAEVEINAKVAQLVESIR